MSKALELAKFGRETPPTGVVVGDSDAQTLSSKTFSDGPVFSGLNANGVPFLNASKVLSSSSTFVFDGTNLGIGIASPAATLHVNASGGGTIRASRSSVGGEYVQLDHDGTDGTLRVSGNNKLYLATNGSTRVTVTGVGKVGIGIPNPTEILTISHSDYESFGLYRNLDYNSVGAMGTRMYFGGYVGSTPTRSAAIDGTLMTATTGRLSFSNLIGGVLTESLRIDTNGSIRIGGTFAAIAATNEKLTLDGGTSQAATLANTSNSSGTLYLKNRSNTAATIQPYIYFNDADGANRAGFGVKYSDASVHQFAQGGINWYTGSSGFSGLTARLNSSQLTMFAGGIIAVENPAGGRYGLFATDSQGTYVSSHNGSGEPLTLNAPSSTAYMNFRVAGADRLRIDNSGYVYVGSIQSTNPTRGILSIVSPSGNTCGISFAESQGGTRGRLWWSGTGVHLYNDDNSPLSFGTTGAERMRITYDGLIGVGTTDPQSLLTINSSGTDSLAGANINQTTDFAANSRAGFSGLTNNNGGFYFGMGANGTGIPAGFGFFREASGWNTALAFYTNNQTSGSYSTRAMQEKMRLTSAGNLLLGSKLDYGKLSIRDTQQKAAITINNDAYFKMYGKLISTYNTAVSNHALCTLSSNTNIGYILKLTITTVSATSNVYNVSEAYAFARWLGGTYQGGNVTQPVTQNHVNMSSCPYSISFVGNGTNLDLVVSCSSPNNYITTSFDVEITCRDAGSVTWYPNYFSQG